MGDDDRVGVLGFFKQRFDAQLAGPEGWLFDDDPAKINRIEAEFQKVTPALVQKTAQEYLRPSNRTILVTEPKAAATADPKSGK